MGALYYFYDPLGGKTHAVRDPEKSCLRDGLGAGSEPTFMGDVLSLPAFCSSDIFSSATPPIMQGGPPGHVYL